MGSSSIGMGRSSYRIGKKKNAKGSLRDLKLFSGPPARMESSTSDYLSRPSLTAETSLLQRCLAHLWVAKSPSRCLSMDGDRCWSACDQPSGSLAQLRRV